MIFKSYILEQNLESINNYKLFLFYGEKPLGLDVKECRGMERS